MAEINAAARLSLKDQFSSGIKGAGQSVKDFGSTALGAMDKVNKTFSGLGATLAAVGVTIGVGAAVKTYIDLDDRIVRIGTSIDAAAGQTTELKRRLYEVAGDPAIKMGTDSLLDAMEVFADKNFDTEFIMDSLRDVGIAMKATGATGEEVANFFIESFKKGMSRDEIRKSLDDMSVIGDQLHNQFSLSAFTQALPGLEAANALLGNAAMNTTELFTAMNVLGAGTKSPARAVSAYTAVVNELADPHKQEKLYAMGIRVRDTSGQFRNLADILQEIAASDEGTGNFDNLTTVFSGAAMDAIMAYNKFGKLADGLEDLGDTTGVLEQKASANASSLKSNLANLQTAFMGFADKQLTGPLEQLTGFLNTLSEDPERIEKYLNTIKWGLAGIAAIKITSGIISFIGGLRNAFGNGNKIDLSGTGGEGIPVYVTNLGSGGIGGGGGLPIPNPGNPSAGTGAPSAGVPNFFKKIPAALAGISPYLLFGAAVIGTSIAIDRNHVKKYAIDGKQYSEWADQARQSAAVGDRVSEVEAQIAALRIQIPEYEMLRGNIPLDEEFQHWDINGSSRMVTIGELKNELSSLQQELASIAQLPDAAPATAVLEGNASMDININVNHERTETTVSLPSNTMPVRVNTGHVRDVRMVAP